MKTILNKLTKNEVEFVCGLANNTMTQIPWIEPTNVYNLEKDNFIKHIQKKRVIKLLTDKGKLIIDRILTINSEL